jgi:ferrous iron transport protein A
MTHSPKYPLSQLKKGQRAEIIEINEKYLNEQSPLMEGELERRLLEMGFSEGSMITLMHEAPFGKEAIVVLLRSCHLIALRKKEAGAIVVQLIEESV